MLQNKWFKLFIWITATAFFFLASALVISYFSPEARNSESMNYMAGMMKAMHGSTMGLSMSLEHDGNLNYIIALSAKITLPLIALAVLLGLIVSVRRLRNDK